MRTVKWRHGETFRMKVTFKYLVILFHHLYLVDHPSQENLYLQVFLGFLLDQQVLVDLVVHHVHQIQVHLGLQVLLYLL